MDPTNLDERLFRELLVDFWPIGDVLCTVCVIQCRQSLLNVALGGGDGGNNGRLGAPTQGVLQDASQFAFSDKQISHLTSSSEIRLHTVLTCKGHEEHVLPGR